MGKKRVITIGAKVGEEEKRKKEYKKRQKKLEKEKAKKIKEKKIEEKIEEPASVNLLAGKARATEGREKKKEEAKKVEKKVEKKEEVAKRKAEKIIEEKLKPKKKVAPKVIKRGKAYKKVAELVDKNKIYSLDEAIKLIKKTPLVKFDASVELHIRLGVDLEKSEQNVRGTFLLPAGTGKTKKVLVFTESKEKEARDAGADLVGSDELIDKVKKGFSGFDVILATPDIMPKVATLGKILGQKGLMPNPKAKTITQDIAKAVKEIKKGRIEFKMDPQGIIHQVVGRVSFENSKLLDNIKALMEAVLGAKSASLKGDYIKSITLCSTMGPGIKIKY